MTDNKFDPSISRTQLPAVDRSRTAQKTAEAGVRAADPGNLRKTAATADTVRITTASQRLADLENTVMRSPDVRAERVAQLKQAVADGSYRPSAERIADRLISQELTLMGGRR